MKVQHYSDVSPIPVEEIEEATQGLTIRRVISAVDGATDFTMDIFEIRPDGHSAFHVHPWEHQVFVIHGEGVLVGAEDETPFGTGDVIFIAPNEPHQFRNTGNDTIEFVCLVPQAALTAYYLDSPKASEGEQG
jgi:quercetin dioxygenase-like cupin family protein